MKGVEAAMELRLAQPHDYDALYNVALLTGDGGADGTHLFDDPRLLGEVFVGPYIHLEPEFAYSVELDGPAGYVLGCLDTRSLEDRCESSWWPPLRVRYPLEDVRRDSDQELVRFIHYPERRSEALVRDFPSHLHIDLAPRAQGHGYGARFLEFLLDRLTQAGSLGVHLGVASGNLRAQHVYRSLGFRDWESAVGELIMTKELG
jgi:ribosomal protein S18 acetylase RimI-like enzyme